MGMSVTVCYSIRVRLVTNSQEVGDSYWIILKVELYESVPAFLKAVCRRIRQTMVKTSSHCSTIY